MKLREVIGWLVAAIVAVLSFVRRPRPVITGGTVCGPGAKGDTTGTLDREAIERMQEGLKK